jgi:hypothetical protein
MENLLKYEWNHELIEFEVIEGRVMVNATQMGKLFNAIPKDFLINQKTELFINACLKSENSRLILDFQEGNSPLESENSHLGNRESLLVNVIHGGRKNGTWMHRILALKYAAWLDPDFELWVYATIDHILFDHYRRLEESLRRSAVRQNRMEQIKARLNEVPEFMELQTLELEEKQESYRRSKENKNQLELFRNSGDAINNENLNKQLMEN